MVIIPIASMRKLVVSSHWIFHSGRDRRVLDDEELTNSIRIKSTFGFFYTGLTISKLIDRELADDDFPIENEGTYSDENFRYQYLNCCQQLK